MNTQYRIAFSSYYETRVLVERVFNGWQVRLRVLAAQDRHGEWVKFRKDHTAQHPQLFVEWEEIPKAEAVAALLSSNVWRIE